MNSASSCALFVTAGVLVASENLTVMVSPFENTASRTGSGSVALMDVMNGPALSPKLPSNGGDLEVDASDVSSWFLRLPLSFTVIVNTPSVGETPVESMMVITRADGLAQEPT